MRGVACLIVAVACAPLVAQVADRKPFDRWALSRVKTVSDPRPAPGGGQLAYVVETPLLSENASRTDVYLTSIEGGAPRRMTTEGRRNSDPRWAPDSQRFIYVSDRDGKPQVWITDLAGETRALTSLPGGATDPAYGPLGERVFFKSRVFPECGLDMECNARRFAAAEGEGAPRVFTSLPLAAGAGVEALFVLSLVEADARPVALTPLEGPAGALGDYAVAPDGGEVCYAWLNGERPQGGLNTDLHTVATTGGEAVRVTGGGGADSAPSYSPDGAYLAYLSQDRPGHPLERRRLVLHDRASGAPRVLTEGLDRSVEGFAWAPDSSRLFFTAEDQGRRPAYTVRLDGTGLRMVVYGNAYHSELRVAEDGRSIIYLAETASRPPEVVQGFSSGEQPRQITHVNDALFDEYATGDVNEVKWRGADGVEVSGFLVTPPGLDFEGRYPLLTVLHGGGVSWGERWQSAWNAQVLAGAGYLVFLPNPRGSAGYGARFLEAMRTDWPSAVVSDVLAGVDMALARPYVDAQKLYLAAEARGAAAAAALLAETGRFGRAVVSDPLVDASAAFGYREEPHVEAWRLYGTPAERLENYAEASIWGQLESWKVPTLVLGVGERAPEGLALFRALRGAGVEARVALFDGGLTPRGQAAWYDETVGWLDAAEAPQVDPEGAVTSPETSSAPE